MEKGTFIKSSPLQNRQERSKKIINDNKNCIPIICELEPKSKLKLDKNKFIVPNNITLGMFMATIRKRIPNLNHEQAIFMLINNKIMGMSDTLDIIYAKEKDEDGFLYLTFYEESTFG